MREAPAHLAAVLKAHLAALTAAEPRTPTPAEHEAGQTLDAETSAFALALADSMPDLLAAVRKKAEKLPATAKAIRDLAVPESVAAKVRKVVEAALTRAYAAGQRSIGRAMRTPTAHFTEAQADVVESFVTRGGLIGPRAREFFRNKAFWVTGLLLDDILKRGQTVLFNALKQDKTKGQVLYELDQALNEYLPERDSLGRAVNVPHRIETIARTNIAEAVNEGRWAAMTDPELDGFITLVRYSAVLDNRTRENHRAWDGVTLPPDHPAWFGPPDSRPPNGHNCRCILVPISAADTDTPQTPDEEIPTVPASDPGFE